MPVPGISAFTLEPLQDIPQRSKVLELFAARFAEEDDDRDAPEALPRDAPVGPLRDHLVDAVFAPTWEPLDGVNLLERGLAQSFRGAASLPRSVVGGLVHLDEPLLGGAENDRIVTAPAVRIAVFVLRGRKERATIGKELDDDRIRGEDILALVFGQAFEEDAAVVERCVNLQAVLCPVKKSSAP